MADADRVYRSAGTIAEMTPRTYRRQCGHFCRHPCGGPARGADCHLLVVCFPPFSSSHCWQRCISNSVPSRYSAEFQRLRPAVVALIACAGVNMLLLALWGEAGLSSGFRIPDWISAVLVLGCFFVLRSEPSPITVMLGSGVLGGAAFLIQQALN